MATRLPFSGEQYWNACKRNAFRGALMYTYQAGTTDSAKTTWTEADEAIAHPNPVQADANGIFPEIYGSGAYYIEIKNNSGDQIIYQADNYEYNAGTGVGGGKYEIVAADPGFGVYSPAKTDGSGNFLKIIPDKSEGKVLLSQGGAQTGQDATTAIQDLCDSFPTRSVWDLDCTFSSFTLSSTSHIISGHGTLTGTTLSTGVVIANTVTKLDLSEYTIKNCSGIVTSDATNVFTSVRIVGTTVDSCERGYHLNGAASNVFFSCNDIRNINKTAATGAGSCQGIRIGDNTKANSDASKNIIVSNNVFDSIRSDFSNETHACLVYGSDITISGNTVNDVYHSAEVACEGLYTKGAGVSITGNTLKDCGPSNDGCINMKGDDRGTLTEVAGHDCTASGNTVINTRDKDVIGITGAVSNSTITGNTMYNCYPRVFANATESTISGNTIFLEADAPTSRGFLFAVDNVGGVNITGNTFKLSYTNYTVGTFDAARVRNAGASPIDGIVIKGNSFSLEFDTMIGATYIAPVNFWADADDITGIDYSENSVTVIAPLANTNDINAIALTGANNLSGSSRSNKFNDTYFYYENNIGSHDFKFNNNEMGADLEATTGNIGVTSNKVTGLLIHNEGATGIRIANLPAAVAGINLDVQCLSATYAFTVNVQGADSYTDASTSKSMAVGSGMRLICKTTGVWQISSQSGTIT
jgi:hypothetical protein